MRTFLFLLSLALFLSSCGKEASKTSTPQSPTAQSPTQNPAPVAPTSPPSPTLKWTQNEIDNSTVSCASGADESIATYEQWTSFCRCSYTAAAKRWTRAQFLQNFDEYFDLLYNDGVIGECASSAGMNLT